jgi:acetoin utilization deacetylase AcuC-like enzyme
MSTAYFTHADCRRHDMGPGHPECPARLDAIEDHFLATGLADVLVRHDDAPVARSQDLAHAHASLYLDELDETFERVAESGALKSVDPDTAACPHTRQAALRAAGAAVAATDLVLDGQAENAFCAIRPPGHHATRDAAMGFCFYNNVAIAARHALDVRGLERVAIVDFDVHHGNGTEDIIAGDERMLMVSIFEDQLYPFSGNQPLAGNMLNVPVPAYTRGAEVREIVEQQWLPLLEKFRPQMIFISAGFDAHRDDDLGRLGLVEADYEWITRRLVEVAKRHAQGRIVSCLEGGYNLQALARSAAAHVRVLAGVQAGM